MIEMNPRTEMEFKHTQKESIKMGRAVLEEQLSYDFEISALPAIRTGEDHKISGFDMLPPAISLSSRIVSHASSEMLR